MEFPDPYVLESLVKELNTAIEELRMFEGSAHERTALDLTKLAQMEEAANLGEIINRGRLTVIIGIVI